MTNETIHELPALSPRERLEADVEHHEAQARELREQLYELKREGNLYRIPE